LACSSSFSFRGHIQEWIPQTAEISAEESLLRKERCQRPNNFSQTHLWPKSV
jgi:hypothetical protein